MRKVILLLLILFSGSNLFSQNGWVAFTIPSPGGGSYDFADQNTGILTGQHKYYKTTNGGSLWSGYPVPDTSSTIVYGGVYLINSQTGWLTGGSTVSPIPYSFIQKTTNGGLNWGPMVSTYTIKDLLFINQGIGFMASGDVPMFVTEGSLIKTSDGGNNWSLLLSDYFSYEKVSFINPDIGWVYCYFADDVGTFVNKILKTSNGGDNWSSVLIDSANGTFSPFKGMQFFDENTGYIMKNTSFQNVLYKSTNGGSIWSAIDTNNFTGCYIWNFFFLNKDTGWVTTVGFTGKIFRTNNGGESWTTQNTTASNINGRIYFIDALTGWALASNTTILKTTTGGVTDILNISSEIPTIFNLYQNFPNPFNPSTRIKFDIPKQGNVKLTVYDISGKEVNVLVNSELKAGSYEYNFDGSGLSSGVYFYKLQSGGFIKTERMVLVK